MRTVRNPRFWGAALCVASWIAAVGCEQTRTDVSSQPSQPEYVTAATVKDLMDSLVDPSADVVWLSGTAVQSGRGLVETAPHTDEEWKKVRRSAIALTEAANLLMVPGRHVARPGEKSETPGVELEPEEMEALIVKDLRSGRADRTCVRRVSRAVLVSG